MNYLEDLGIKVVKIETESRFLGYWNLQYGIITKEPLYGPELPTEDEITLYYGGARAPFDGSLKKRRYWKKVTER